MNSKIIADPGPGAAAQSGQNPKTQELLKLKQAAQQFEAIFLSQVMKAMRSTVPEGGVLKRGMANDFFQSMFDEEVSLKMAEKQTRSFADLIFRQLAGKLNSGVPMEELLQGIEKAKQKNTESVPINMQQELNGIIDSASNKYGVDPHLVQAVIHRESSGDPQAVSTKGAKGLMQLMDATAEMLAVEDPFDPRQNVFGGTQYLKQLLNQFDNDLELALAAYHAGPTRVRRFGGVPPISATQNYVRNVMETYQSLKTNQTLKA